MARSSVRGAYGTIVHSHFARNAVEQVASAPVRKVDFPFPGEPLSRSTAPDNPSHKVQLLTFGYVNPNKMVAEIVETIGQSDILKKQVEYHVVGKAVPQYEEKIKALIKRYDLHKQVYLHGYQPQEQLERFIQSADIVTNLRNPHFGEASWSLIEALFAGTPTVVWAHGYYDEFPDDVVVKVHNTDELRTRLEHLSQDAATRQAFGDRGRAYAEATFLTERYVTQALEFFEQALYNQPVLQLTDRLVQQINEMGGANGFPDLPDIIAREIEALI